MCVAGSILNDEGRDPTWQEIWNPLERDALS